MSTRILFADLGDPLPVTAAFFDLDNTLIRGSSLFHVGRVLVRRGVVSRLQLVRFAGAEARYVRTRTEIKGGAQGIADRLLHLLAGRTTSEIEPLCSEAVEEILHGILVPLVAAHVYAHQEAGRPTFLVTASPHEIADPIADALGMSGCVATTLEHHDGIYTGKVHGPIVHGPRKAAEVTILAAKLGLDVARSYLYSDSANDLPLLSQVRYPVVVNGNRSMRRTALRGNWAVLDTRRPSRTIWPYRADSYIHLDAMRLERAALTPRA